MKILLIELILFGIISIGSISSIYANLLFDNYTNEQNILTIDNKDSVYFNLKAATISGDLIDVPIYIESDDDINALDFGMVFNTEKLVYQKIIDHTGHIQYTDYFNPLDQTLRFTSNSFTTYNSNVKIISVRFKLISQCVSEIDFFQNEFLLNGDMCSFKISKGSICRTSANNDFSIAAKYTIYPVPTSDGNIYIDGISDGSMEVLNIDGNVVMDRTPFSIRERLSISNLQSGVYLVKIYTSQSSFSKRIIILSN